MRMSITWSEIRDVVRYSATITAQMEGEEFTQPTGFGLVNAFGAIMGAEMNVQTARGFIATEQILPRPGSPFNEVYLWGDLVIDEPGSLTIPEGVTEIGRAHV